MEKSQVETGIARRTLLAAGMAALAGPALGQAAPFPDKPVRLIVPFTPGGAADIIGRAIADRLTESYGKPVIVENKPGAGGNIGLDAVAKGEPTGHVIGLASIAVAVNPSLFRSMPFDALRDLAPLSLALETPNVVIVPAQSPIKTIADLIAAARDKPDSMSYASAGIGTSLHLAAELFAQQAGVKLIHVPYKGSAAALIDLAGGRVDVMFDNASTALPQIAGGKVRAIGVTTKTRLSALPDVPAIAEQGLPEYHLANWWALFAPAGTPPALQSRLAQDIAGALKHEKSRAAVAAISGVILAGPPEALKAHLAAELVRWREISAKAGIKPE